MAWAEERNILDWASMACRRCAVIIIWVYGQLEINEAEEPVAKDLSRPPQQQDRPLRTSLLSTHRHGISTKSVTTSTYGTSTRDCDDISIDILQPAFDFSCRTGAVPTAPTSASSAHDFGIAADDLHEAAHLSRTCDYQYSSTRRDQSDTQTYAYTQDGQPEALSNIQPTLPTTHVITAPRKDQPGVFQMPEASRCGPGSPWGDRNGRLGPAWSARRLAVPKPTTRAPARAYRKQAQATAQQGNSRGMAKRSKRLSDKTNSSEDRFELLRPRQFTMRPRSS